MTANALGLLFATQSLGSSMGPLVCGIIADHYGLLATFYFLVGTIIVANFFIFFTPVSAIAGGVAAGEFQPRQMSPNLLDNRPCGAQGPRTTSRR